MNISWASWNVPRPAYARVVVAVAAALLAVTALVTASAQARGEVVNGRFDRDLSGWISDGTWSPVDADGNASSGSLELKASGLAGGSECIPLPEDSLHRVLRFSVQLPANQLRAGRAFARIGFFKVLDCLGSDNLLGLQTGVTLGGAGALAGELVREGVWTGFKLEADRPAGALALRVQLSAEANSAGTEPYVARFDNVVLTASAPATATATPTPAAAKVESTPPPTSAPVESAPAAASAANDDGSDFPWLAVGAAAVVALAVLGGGAALFLRRRT